MNAHFTLRSPIPLAFALCSALGTFGCGGAPDTPPASASDGGATPGFDAGDLPGFDAGSLPGFDAGPSDAGMLEGGACATGLADCDDNPSNGCETMVSSDPKNCGACGHDCTALPNVSGPGVTCDDGVCVVPASACAAGYGHCSSNPDDGCEANLGSAQTCGSCSTQCSGATPDCSAGACNNGCAAATPTSCSGTCVDTTSNAASCGSCGNACPAPANGSPTCAMSTCGFTCNSGHHTCGSACADDTSPLTCGTSCTPCAAPAEGTATCTPQGTCGIGCDSGYHSCDGTTCSSSSDTATCGTSCTPCAAPASNGSATCDGTSCGIACDSGYHLCGGNACDDSSSTATCGSSCTPCATPTNATATCNGVACGYICNAGYADCDGNPANGCEVNLTDDGLNCNACGHSCLGGACTGGACQPVVLATIANPSFLLLDSQNVYFTYNVLNGGVGSVPKAGGALSQSNVITNHEFGALALLGADLYVIDTAFPGVDAIASAQIAGVTPVENAGDPNLSLGSNIVNSRGRLYWSDYGTGTIRVLVATPQTIYTAGTGSDHLDVFTVAPDGYLTWAESTAGYSASRVAGGMPACAGTTCSLISSTLASLSSTPTTVFADATYVYYLTNGSITTVTRGGVVVQSAAIGSGPATSLVVDGTTAYWIAGDNSIDAIPVAGGAVTTVAGGSSIGQIAVDSTAIYWTNSGAGKVMKLAK